MKKINEFYLSQINGGNWASIIDIGCAISDLAGAATGGSWFFTPIGGFCAGWTIGRLFA